METVPILGRLQPHCVVCRPVAAPAGDCDFYRFLLEEENSGNTLGFLT